MTFDGAEKIIAAVGTAVAAALTPLGVIYAASINRSTKAAEASVSSLTVEVERLRDELEAAEEEADREKSYGIRWRQLLIYWFDQCFAMRREVYAARQLAESMARTAGLPKPTWDNDLLLPGMEDPVPKPSAN